MEHFFQSKLFKGIVFGFFGLIILLVGFRVGVLVGYQRAVFSERWGENYQRNFGFMDPHGVAGAVLRVASTSLVVGGEGADTAEKLVNVSDDTFIRRLQDAIKISDIQVGDRVVVLGSPNESGQIEAKLIRIIPNQK